MTDDEKTENYLIGFLQKNNVVNILSIKTAWDLRCLLIGAIKYVLTEGKPKWHEIENHVKPSREISKKYMPKGNQKVMLKYHFYNDEEIHYSDGYYDCYDFEFHVPNNPAGKIICVIAWCELPEFKE